MIRWIKDARRKLAKIPIRVVLSLYILVMFVFAVIYTNIPSGFYHETIRLESGYDKEAEEFSKKILEAMKANFMDVYKKEQLCFDDIEIDITTMNVGKSYVKSERVIVPINLIVEVKNPEKITDKHIDDCDKKNYIENVVYTDFFDISLSTNAIKINDKFFVPLVVTSNVFVKCDNIDVDKINYNQLFKHEGFLSPVIKIDEGIEKEIQEFLLASKGFSNKINNHFLSMLYLSAVTITTIGYGDIVPITLITRMLITIEALMGMTIMGIFLNNITYRE
ncbi:potassium channel family protein [Oceanirhabdus seepicola]|uniref:Two pore domain potassium channel family protein n=1 Tax=Oceanirhabdus seepicola TaxID=2828781 RepID=A0A9J6P322_9CLOT|nr:potassium channel family protein [Oceanirhabdus seepicola]MCM1990923.1 two pore domain potassium channel family protein [Oceanirhabdus seepicola]